VSLLGHSLSFSLHDEVEGRPLTPARMNYEVTSEHDLVSREVDEKKLRNLWRNGAIAWSEVPSATDWVEDLRGGKIG
jgi:hypothetical protein